MTDVSDPARSRDREAQFEFLAENIPVQIWTALPDGHLDFVSTQTARSFGLTVDELLRDGWQNVVHPEDLSLAVERWTHSLSTGQTYEVEFRLKLASGAYAFHLARAVCQRGADGGVLRWFGTNTNIQVQMDEQRRVTMLLEEVASQSKENEAALLALRARIRQLEAQLAAG